MSSNVPYDWFSALIELNAMPTQPLIGRLEIQGRLFSRNILDRHDMRLTVGAYQHFDYFDSDTISNTETVGWLIEECLVPYKLGTPASAGGGLMFRYERPEAWSVDSYFHANAVVLGGILTDLYREYHRNYNWGSGLSMKLGAEWKGYKDRLAVSVAGRYYQLWTWMGYDENFDWSLTPEGKPVNVQGDTSRASFVHVEASADYRLWKDLFFTLEIDYFTRKTKYDAYIHLNPPINGMTAHSMPVILSHQVALQAMLTYKF